MANHYDKILKENLEEIFIPITEKILGISLENAQELPDAVQITLGREPNLLKIIDDEYILQVEFQVADDPDMADRMFVYYALLWSKYHIPIKQYVIFIGDKQQLRMSETLTLENANFRYQIINLQNIGYEHFLESEQPEEVLLAILSDFHGENPEKPIKLILDKIHQLSPQPLRFGKYARQLEVLSKLRNLQSLIVKYLETMPIVYDLETDIRFLQGQEKGIQQGIEQGIEQGIDKGIDKGMVLQKRKSIKGMILSNLLTFEQIAAIEDGSLEFVKMIAYELEEEK
jgi:hypothetical protein